MRRTAAATGAALLAGALALTACSSGDDAESTETVTETATTSPSESPTATPTSEPAEPSEPAGPTESDTSAPPAPAPPTTVTADTLLPPDVLGTADQPREETAGVTAWRLSEACDQVTPEAADMVTVSQGSGEFEEPVGLQQVAVFADSDAAATAADALAAAFGSCTAQEATAYVVEPLEVGAQGTGLATDYYGASTAGPLDEALGSYVALTRRGNAVVLTGYEGGEAQVGTARENTTALLDDAWQRLCGYDSAGC
ncbi:hypothetical protein [Litorihabitans aurantiacus]|uniref:PknH-like extracellular domain-containing protein n=1 Tax=Litorihabitans aurantiacus TaxID=1930061 RepID=A0AA37XHI5_9MICO|nr:hypothetical protein [Litorihabitans aurantiacus]GMA33452.1 hypothetical protein GCM10025875_34440 [Litorihabitans aurantiacus]